MSSSKKRARPSECDTAGFFNNCQFNPKIELLQISPPTTTRKTAPTRYLPQGRPLFAPPLLAAPSQLKLHRPKPHVYIPPNRDDVGKKPPMKPLGPAPTLKYMSFDSPPRSSIPQTNPLSFENSFQNIKKRKYSSDTGLERSNCTLSNDEEVFVEAAVKLARDNDRKRARNDELNFSHEHFRHFSENPVVTSRNYKGIGILLTHSAICRG